jgi:hypothetical protein
MAKGTGAAPDMTTAVGDPATMPDRGTIHTLLGRGRTGKTTWARWAVERARLAGRDVAAADGDRNNGTLGSFYRDARSPAAGDDATMTAWLENLTEETITRRGSLVLDMGGGDRAFATVAQHHGFNEVLPAEGVDLVAWYFLAGGRDDAETLVHMEAMGFQPPRTVIVLNEGLAPVLPAGQDPFAAALRAKSVQRVLDRGAKLLRMPATPLATMVAADALFIGIHDAAHRGVPRDENGLPHRAAKPLDMWRGNELKRWLAAMEERHAAAEVTPWLP